MNTGPEERLSYRELARQQARLERVISVHRFSRLHSLTGAGTDPEAAVTLQLEFYRDDQGWSCVRGAARTTIELLCHRCAELVQFPLVAQWDVCIVDESAVDPQILADVADRRDLLSVHGALIGAVDIAEDELLLALPEKLCSGEPCERMPALAYPAASGDKPALDTLTATDDSSTERRRPFAGLADLIADQASGSGGSMEIERADGSDSDPERKQE